jgi:hypothetical protein
MYSPRLTHPTNQPSIVILYPPTRTERETDREAPPYYRRRRRRPPHLPIAT